ncbi:hypothetical protein [Curvivirga sp.]|uniref:hypothetical protein n=1 Tax=Curvivirga sp. TaxID=2856848 RepID=UPI003B5BB3B6
MHVLLAFFAKLASDFYKYFMSGGKSVVILRESVETRFPQAEKIGNLRSNI